MRFWFPLCLLGACGFDDTLVGTPPSAPESPEWSPFPDPASDDRPRVDPLASFAIPIDQIRGSGSRGSGLALVGDVLYVADRDHGRVVTMSASDLDVLGVIDVGAGPTQLVADARGSLFVTLAQAGEVVRIDPGAGGVTARLSLDGGPWGIAVDGSGDVWVSLGSGSALLRIDRDLQKVREHHTLDGTPRGVCVDAGNRVAVMLQSGRMHVIDWRLDSPERDVDLVGAGQGRGTHALGVAPDPRADRFHAPIGIARPDRSIAGAEGRPIRGRMAAVRDGSILESYDEVAIDQPAEVVHHPTLSLSFVVSTGEGAITMFDSRTLRPLGAFGAGVAPRALTLSPSGQVVYVLAEGDLQVRKYDLAGYDLVQSRVKSYADDPLPAEVRVGRRLFYGTARWGMSGVACASCHVFGASDGISWPMADVRRETPALAGRLEGTAPYGWDGRYATLDELVRDKLRRLGGSSSSFTKSELDALVLYVSRYLPEPPRPRLDALRGRRARGAIVFHSEAAGCATCHAGPTLSDALVWDVGTSAAPINTPSLLDVFASAPYFHDGSAPTLRDVLTRHGPRLVPDDRDALVAYLRSL